MEGYSQSKKKSPARKSLNEAASKDEFVVQYIEIEHILTYDATMYFILNNSEIHKFMFPSAERLTQAITNILKNSKAYLNLRLELTDMKKEEERVKVAFQKKDDQIDERILIETLYKQK
mmetsp:Transcript_7733/g.7165  ORF Transcript_7733/g.7165 Transcript_7733/m.7165 type:complete len:119 (-) Transcript_7733:1599-1955(-)